MSTVPRPPRSTFMLIFMRMGSVNTVVSMVVLLSSVSPPISMSISMTIVMSMLEALFMFSMAAASGSPQAVRETISASAAARAAKRAFFFMMFLPIDDIGRCPDLFYHQRGRLARPLL